MLRGLMAPPPAEIETGPGTGPGTGTDSAGDPGPRPGHAADPAVTAVTGGSPASAPLRPDPRPGSGRGPGTGPRTGAVGAISSAVSALRASGVMELDPMTIHAGGLADRLDEPEEEAAKLRRSIAEQGQQVPVLVRPHPRIAGEWQIVYGRRRTLAARDLGIRVKALVRDLDDRALVIAQGQENSARRDLSFIEKAGFAARMQAAGYDRAAIEQALSADRTLVARMLSLTARLPWALIEAIGSAQGVGRPRWLELAGRFEAARAREGLSAEALAARLAEEIPIALARAGADPRSSDPAGADPAAPASAPVSVAASEASAPAARFEAALRLLRPPRPAAAASSEAPAEIRSHDGRRLGLLRRSSRGASLALSGAPGFETWLAARLPDLHAAWQEEETARPTAPPPPSR